MTKQWLVKVTFPDGHEDRLTTRAGRPHTAMINAVYHCLTNVLRHHTDKRGTTLTCYDAGKEKVWPLVVGIRIEFLGKDPTASPKPKSIQQQIREEREKAKEIVPDFTPIFGADTNNHE